MMSELLEMRGKMSPGYEMVSFINTLLYLKKPDKQIFLLH